MYNKCLRRVHIFLAELWRPIELLIQKIGKDQKTLGSAYMNQSLKKITGDQNVVHSKMV